MENALDQLMKVLGARYGWLSTVVCWVGACKIIFGLIEDRLTAVLTRAANSGDPDDDRDWETILHSRWYRTISAIVYFLFSIRLPELDDFLALKTKNQKPNLPI